MAAALTLIGVDFTSAPRPAKPITAAFGRLEGDAVVLERLEKLPDWPAFESLLIRPGPWLGAFDFPFGLPREAVVDLGWPTTWPGGRPADPSWPVRWGRSSESPGGPTATRRWPVCRRRWSSSP